MKIPRAIYFIAVCTFIISLIACTSTEKTNDEGFDQVYTQAAKTILAGITQTANLFSQTPSITSSPSPIPPSETPIPTDTITHTPEPSHTNTPTDTPTPTQSPTIETIICDWAKFLADISIQDGTILTADTEFIKTWRLRNIGSCSWTTEYDLVYATGDRLDSEITLPLPGTVLPGQSIDLSVRLIAPEEPGVYRGLWLLRNADGVLFGLGDDAAEAFWVDIAVVEPNHKYPYDFATNYCAAIWKSGAGYLPCPGEEGYDGFVAYLSNPELENRSENEPTIWLHPNEETDGWISGKFPPIIIKEGDSFQAWVGCMADSKGCDITFLLSYQIGNGLVKNLASWHEVFDGYVSPIDLDLSHLDGKSVQFIFSVEVNSKPRKADAFWFVPRIVRYGDVE